MSLPRPDRTPRRFPPPWRVVEGPAAFVVEDAAGSRLAYVYFDVRPEAASNLMALNRDQARRIAVNFARLPELIAGRRGA